MHTRMPPTSWHRICRSDRPCRKVEKPPTWPMKVMPNEMRETTHAAVRLESAAWSSAVVASTATEDAMLAACAGAIAGATTVAEALATHLAVDDQEGRQKGAHGQEESQRHDNLGRLGGHHGCRCRGGVQTTSEP
jgi:hypothetical protein